MDKYDAHTIETKWQRGLGGEPRLRGAETPSPGAPPQRAEVLRPSRCWPYPSGSIAHRARSGLHARRRFSPIFYRRTGCEVLRPMGYDSFGLPAEKRGDQGGRAIRARSSSETS